MPSANTGNGISYHPCRVLQAAGYMEWAGILRTLDAEDPSYKD